jgi:sRNA-binding protein
MTMDKKPRPTLTLKKKPAAGPAKAGKPQKPKRKPAKALPPHRRPSDLKAQALVERLQQDYPDLFPPDGQPMACPWAIGIHDRIMQRYRVSQRIARKALEHWAKRRAPEYARCLAQGGPRYDLDGPRGEVADRERRTAKDSGEGHP